MSSPRHPAFKAYDIRGKLPHELNTQIAYHIGRGLAVTTGAKRVVLGMDSRLSSPQLLAATAAGLAAQGAQAFSLGLCGTEEVYHATGAHGYDLGIMVTASHNPAEYNGMKFLKKGGAPFTHDADIPALNDFVMQNQHLPAPTALTLPPAVNHREAYIAHLLELAPGANDKPRHIVINAGNGAAGPTADALLKHLPNLSVTRVHHTPDGTFPNGIPNPLLPQNRASTADAVKQHNASLGIAWDGDFDRCFLYDEHGTFISNYYICSLLARALLAKEAGATITHDPRQYWDTKHTIESLGGTALISRVGHGYIKPQMREHNAIFGGEISGHFYFRDFFFCDTGMLPWLLILELMNSSGKTLSQLVAEHATAAPASDEINFITQTPAKQIMEHLKTHYLAQGAQLETVDGISLAFPTWRTNIRSSSNEPLLRLNVEAKTEQELSTRLAELTQHIENQGATLSDH